MVQFGSVARVFQALHFPYAERVVDVYLFIILRHVRREISWRRRICKGLSRPGRRKLERCQGEEEEERSFLGQDIDFPFLPFPGAEKENKAFITRAY